MIRKFGLVAQLNSASDYGSEGYRFESCRVHKQPDGATLKQVAPFIFKILQINQLQKFIKLNFFIPFSYQNIH